MNEWWALFYGLVQGITEFLPVSSSGHLALIPSFFELKDPGVFFDLTMHVGTALAILVYFNKEVVRLLKGAIALLKKRSLDIDSFFAFNFILATMASVALILLIKDSALAYGRSANFIAFNLAFFGILLYFSDRRKPRAFSMEHELRLKIALVIGASQALAIFPGVSRSGATITAGRFLGLSRLEASRFSFLLSLPIIFASFLYKAKDLLSGAETAPFDLWHMLIGATVSFLVGILTIHYFLKFLARVGLGVYTLYRLALAALVFWLGTN